MNWLICSVGRRVELVQWFKEELNKRDKKLYVTDQDINAPALYFADDYFILDQKDYPSSALFLIGLIQKCKKFNITNVLSLHDEQILFLSKHISSFDATDIKLLLSCHDIIYKTYNKALYKDFPINQIPITIVKNQFGSASAGFEKILQPYLEGKEFNAQCYFDIHTKKLINVFIQQKISMRSGETDKSFSTWDDEVYEEVKKLDGLFRGVIDIDLIKSYKTYIIDINPRFGGAYPLVHYCGMNYVKQLIDNVDGRVLASQGFYKHGVTMMKYNGLYFKENL